MGTVRHDIVGKVGENAWKIHGKCMENSPNTVRQIGMYTVAMVVCTCLLLRRVKVLMCECCCNKYSQMKGSKIIGAPFKKMGPKQIWSTSSQI